MPKPVQPLRSSLAALAALILATGCESDPLPPGPTSPDAAATDVDASASRGAAEGIDVIVQLDPSLAPGGHARNRARAVEIAADLGIRPSFAYGSALLGFAGAVSKGRITALENDPRIVRVERDQAVRVLAQTVPTGVRRIFAEGNSNLDIDGTDDLRVDADIAILDTGIDLEHADLEVAGEVYCMKEYGSPRDPKIRCEEGKGYGRDNNGHGTHVAGTAAALDNGIGVVGVAPGARLWAVKVLDGGGSGTISTVVAGIDWVTENAEILETANMSLGCECMSDVLDAALANSVAAGVTYSVSAGNSDADASTFSPANHPDVITVSALADFDGEPGALGDPTCLEDEDDTSAFFTNWGDLIEIAAPGVCITSTLPGGGYGMKSGTSMASPHVAGAAALLAGSGVGSPAEIRQTLIDSGNRDWIDDSGDGVQEPLLDVGDATVFAPATVSGDGDGGVEDAPPSVTLTSPQDGATLSGWETLSADVFDDLGVAQVEFFVDGASVGVDGDGGNGWSVSWNSAEVADGSHEVNAEATDTGGQTTSTQPVSVTVDNGFASNSVHVGDLDGWGVNDGSTWTARLYVFLHDSAEQWENGETVHLAWDSGDDAGTVECPAPEGWCKVDLPGFAKRISRVTFTVTDVADMDGDGLAYAADDNHDPDGDSDGTTIVITR